MGVPGGPLAVVVGVADNFSPNMPMEVKRLVNLTYHLGQQDVPIHRGSVNALNAETGRTLWAYNVHDYQSWVYPLQWKGCMPDAFGNPAIGGDGTVYINWSGGQSYA